jgi:hypothetical protein
MRFIDLVQRLRAECVGVSGSGPTTVTAQTGDNARLVEWIASAYQDIQNLHSNWNFLRADFSFSTVAAQQNYTPAQAGAADIGEWKRDSFRVYTTAVGVTSEIDIPLLSWEDFRREYLFGALRVTTSKPMIAGRKPDRSLAFWPIPDGDYTINGEYWRAPDVMVGSDDTPLMPEQYHMVIVWRALVFYAHNQASPESYAHGQAEYKRLLTMLARAELPEVTFG